jgi:hypothetical protein
MKAKKMNLLLGNDEFHRSFNGQMKDYNFGYGPGAYRTHERMEAIYSTTIFEVVEEYEEE